MSLCLSWIKQTVNDYAMFQAVVSREAAYALLGLSTEYVLAVGLSVDAEPLGEADSA